MPPPDLRNEVIVILRAKEDTTLAGSMGVITVVKGRQYDIPDEISDGLIRAGIMEPVVKKIETEMIEQKTETEMKPRPVNPKKGIKR